MTTSTSDKPPRLAVPAVIRLRRKDAGLTQVEAAHLIHKSLDAYRGYERGRRTMDMTVWELFWLKTARFVRGRQQPKEI